MNAGFAGSGGKMLVFNRVLSWPKRNSDLRKKPSDIHYIMELIIMHKSLQVFPQVCLTSVHMCHSSVNGINSGENTGSFSYSTIGKKKRQDQRL